LRDSEEGERRKMERRHGVGKQKVKETGRWRVKQKREEAGGETNNLTETEREQEKENEEEERREREKGMRGKATSQRGEKARRGREIEHDEERNNRA